MQQQNVAQTEAFVAEEGKEENRVKVFLDLVQEW